MKILVHDFLRLCLLCIVKIFWLDSNKTHEGDTFWNLPHGNSGNCIAAAAQRSPGYCNWTGGAASCCDRSSGAFRTAGIRNWRRSELGAQSGRKNPPACMTVRYHGCYINSSGCVYDKGTRRKLENKLANDSFKCDSACVSWLEFSIYFHFYRFRALVYTTLDKLWVAFLFLIMEFGKRRRVNVQRGSKLKLAFQFASSLHISRRSLIY